MHLESDEKVKLLDEYIEMLKQDLLFLMAECKRKSQNSLNHKIITTKQELDRVIKEKMRLSQICHSSINSSISLAAATG